MKKAIVLCSGGLDSIVTAHYVKKRLGYDKIVVLFFNYNQKALKKEREFSKRCAKELKAEFREIKIHELAKLSDSLINKGDNSKIRNKKGVGNTVKESEQWYVPCRNAVFLMYALALAESNYVREKKKSDIFVGFKNEGKEPFPDATQEFVNKMNSVSKEMCSNYFKIHAPLIRKDKEDIIILGLKLGVDFNKTFSCYVGLRRHCGECLACRLRKKGFCWANIEDPTNYEL
ncbi:MAG: 7-cyano-7-deazaguanine synthase [Nanoarchaeota archaeon]|nr:7-cyano-7-deazaguanine synthase [Nanoarchaeota archaeon]